MATTDHKQRGAVSLFIVIFSALLIITIVTAFVRIMLQDHQQATASDLSKSAMDSAQAGVEDSKRALVEYYKGNCHLGAPSDRCNSLREALLVNVNEFGWTMGCDTTRRAGVAELVDNEVKVESSDKDSELDQAYTCVKIQMNPEYYIGNSASQMVQLKTKDNAAFDTVKVEWYEQQDDAPLDLEDGPVESNYIIPQSWPAKRPQVLRLQLLQYGADFALDSFDSDNQHNATLFLLPKKNGPALASFVADTRKSSSSGSAQDAACNETPTRGSYACSMTISLPSTPSGETPRTAYLKVDQLNVTGNKKFKLSLFDTQPDGSQTQIRFADVQVAVDSTGRANDMFKRIESRVDIGGSIPTPDAAVDVTRSFCKEFLVTNTGAYDGSQGTKCPIPTN